MSPNSLAKWIFSVLCLGILAASDAKKGDTSPTTMYISPESFGHKNHKELARLVYHLRVPIIDGSRSKVKQCIPTSATKTFGFYSPAVNVMVLCTANGDSDQMHKTFVHESVHMVQDCRGGLANSASEEQRLLFTELQYNQLNKKDIENIHHFYTGKAAIFEVEARKLSPYPSLVFRLMSKYCNA